jgi:hypothetical protein
VVLTVWSRLGAVVSAVVLAGCGITDPSGGLPPGDAQLAVINSLPESTVTAVLVDDGRLTVPASGERISRVLAAGTHRIEARGVGGRPLGSAQFSVAVGGRRTAIIGGSVLGGGVVIVAGDTATAPGPVEAKVRVVNTVANAPALEAWLESTDTGAEQSARLESPFSYGVSLEGEFPEFVVRRPGRYRVRVTDQTRGAVQAEREVTMVGGEVWSVILIRGADGELALVPVRETGGG